MKKFLISLIAIAVTLVAFAQSSNNRFLAQLPNLLKIPQTSTPVLQLPQTSGGTYATIMGVQSGVNFQTTAFETTAIGYKAGGSGGNTGDGLGGGTGLSGTENTCVGWQCMTQLTSGQNDTSFGVNTLGHETTGGQNDCFGTDSCRDVNGANNNVAYGFATMRDGNGVTGNVAVGTSALRGSPGFPSTTTGGENTCVGFNCMSSTSMTTANHNTVVGNSAGQGITTGNNNTIIGATAGGTTLTTGVGNILIGINTDVPAAGTNNYLNLGGALKTSIATQSGAGLSGCGSSPAITGTDLAGTITTGSGATGCILNLSMADSNPPTCVVTSRSGTQPVYTTTDNGTTATLQLTTAAASTKYDYFCPVH